MNASIKLSASSNSTSFKNEISISPLEQKVQNLQKRVKEVEDLSSSPTRLMSRSYSLSPMDLTGKTEKEECEAKSGQLWECVGRSPSRFGGYIYHFQSKEPYNDWTPHKELEIRKTNAAKKVTEIQPAVESPPSNIIRYALNLDVEQYVHLEAQKQLKELTDEYGESFDTHFPDVSALTKALYDKETLSIQGFQQEAKALEPLGYRVLEINGQISIEFPDRQALLGAWQNLKEKHPEKNLPNLDILSIDGIAGDLAFTEAYFTHDVLLSTGQEFCHDHFSHVMIRLLRMLKGSSSYQSEKTGLLQWIRPVYRAIHIAKRVESTNNAKEHWDHLCFIPGMLTDILFSHHDEQWSIYNEQNISAMISTFWERPDLQPYIQRRFPGQKITNVSMDAVCNEVKQVVANFDAQILIARK